MRGLTDGSWTDAHVSALAMAVCLNGMSREETVALTLAMRDSGDTMTWDLDRPVVDKHSTGGVGDVVSLMLAPIVASCGIAVPMVSGRGLGHTGGTLDKMESIPGYTAKPDAETFRRTVREVGCAIIGQTGEIAPADKRFYGIRDVTGTVESVPLITASILSKKLAAGLDGLVLDVKCGNGAFMDDKGKARELATSLVEVANGAGVRTTALLTDMNEPLAPSAGNAVEVREALRFLRNEMGAERLREVTLALAAEMIAVGNTIRGGNDADARNRAEHALSSGEALEVFGRMVSALGGPNDFVDRPDDYLPEAPIVRRVTLAEDATVMGTDARALGVAVVELGGGRTDPNADVDHAVGLSELAPVGARLSKGDTLARIHARSETDADAAERAVRGAYQFGEKGEPTPVVVDRIGS